MKRINLGQKCLFILLPFIILLCSNSSGYADWTVVNPPSVISDWQLNKVHFTSANEGWAVGQGISNLVGVILHYSNGSWTNVSPPILDSAWDDWGLFDVNFITPDLGWAVGYQFDYDYPNGKAYGLILKYSNGSWTPINPPYVSENWLLYGIHFTSSQEGWAIGDDISGLYNAGISLHYSNGYWTNVSLPYISSNWYPVSVYFTSQQEGWIVGCDWKNNGGVLLHYHNGYWESVNPPPTGSKDYHLYGIHFSLPNDGWAVGVDDSDSSAQRGVLFHYFNGSWTNMTSPNFGPYSWGLEGVHFTSPNEGWAVGDYSSFDGAGGGGVALYYQNGSWTVPYTKPDCQFKDIFFTSANDGWAVGYDGANNRGLILRYSPAENISQPMIPSGPISGSISTNYAFTTGGALSNLGHPIEYWFDWGDGTYSIWSSSTSAFHSWTSAGTYNVKAQARCAIHTSIVSEWSQSLQVTITAVGPDLTGAWTTPLAQTCRTIGKNQRCSLKGTFQVSNIGNRDAPSTYVNFYLSDNATYEDGDTQLKSVATGKLKPGKSKAINLSLNLATNQTATGKYIIAVIDKDNLVTEIDKGNNVIVFGPIQ
jgi:hypothetical protein